LTSAFYTPSNTPFRWQAPVFNFTPRGEMWPPGGPEGSWRVHSMVHRSSFNKINSKELARNQGTSY
jgi:hypothetical protein